MSAESFGYISVRSLLSAMPFSTLPEAVQISVAQVVGECAAEEVAALKPFELAARFQAAIHTPNPPEFNPRNLGNIAKMVISHLNACLNGQSGDALELFIKRVKPLDEMELEEVLERLEHSPTSLFRVQQWLNANMRSVERATRGQWVIPLSPRRRGSLHTPNINIGRTVEYVTTLRTPSALANARVRTVDNNVNVRARPITLYKALGISQMLRHPYYDLPVVGTDGHYDISSISVLRMAAVAWARDVNHHLLPLQQPYTPFMQSFTNPGLPYPWEDLIKDYEAAKAAGKVDETVCFFRYSGSARL